MTEMTEFNKRFDFPGFECVDFGVEKKMVLVDTDMHIYSQLQLPHWLFESIAKGSDGEPIIAIECEALRWSEEDSHNPTLKATINAPNLSQKIKSCATEMMKVLKAGPSPNTDKEIQE